MQAIAVAMGRARLIQDISEDGARRGRSVPGPTSRRPTRPSPPTRCLCEPGWNGLGATADGPDDRREFHAPPGRRPRSGRAGPFVGPRHRTAPSRAVTVNDGPPARACNGTPSLLHGPRRVSPSSARFAAAISHTPWSKFRCAGRDAFRWLPGVPLPLMPRSCLLARRRPRRLRRRRAPNPRPRPAGFESVLRFKGMARAQSEGNGARVPSPAF